jgi:ABC-type Fe3+-hydroxamate transport system substrate-binding protein
MQMVRELGSITGQQQKVKEWEVAFHENWAGFDRVHLGTCLYLIWQKPWMAAGGDTFIHDLLTRAGFTNLFGHRSRYPETGLEEIAGLEPGWILLSDEPYPFGEGHREELQKLFPRSRVLCVDGARFSWYSHRVAGMPHYLRTLFRSEREKIA